MGKFFLVCILVLHGALLAKGDIGTYIVEREIAKVLIGKICWVYVGFT